MIIGEAAMAASLLTYRYGRMDKFVLNDICPTGVALGRGSYGCVVEVKCKERVYAAKKIHEVLVDELNDGAEEMVLKFLKECQLMAKLHHQNITQFVGVWFPEGASIPAIVMERLQMSLDNLLVGVADIEMSLKLSVLADVSMGLHYLHTHSPPVLHRDLTARNVLLTDCLVAKITDLGNSRILGVVSKCKSSGSCDARMTRAPGTLVYMAPEATSEVCCYGPALDIFSFGHLALYTITQVFPSNLLPGTFPDPSNQDRILGRSEVQRRWLYFEKMEALCDEKMEALCGEKMEALCGVKMEALRGEKMETLCGEKMEAFCHKKQPSLVELVKQCLHNAPTQRPTSGQLLATLQVIQTKESETHVRQDEVRKLQVSNIMLSKEISDKNRKIKELETKVESLQMKSAQLENIIGSMTVDVKHQGRQESWRPSESERTDDEATDKESLSGVLHMEWETGPAMPVGMSGYLQSVVIETTVYVGGGHANYADREAVVMCYNSNTGKWKKLSEYCSRHFAMAMLKGQLVLVGGCNHDYEDSGTLGIWDTAEEQWKFPWQPMPTRRSNSSAVGWSHWLVVAGGVTAGHEVVASVELLDTRGAGQWMKAPPTPEPLTKMRTCLITGTWYLLGGSVTQKMFSVSVSSLVAHATSGHREDHSLVWSEHVGLKTSYPFCWKGTLYAVRGCGHERDSRADENSEGIDGGIYSYSMNGWIKECCFPMALSHCTCSITASNQLLVAGGYHGTSARSFVSISRSSYLGNLQ